MSLWLEVVCLNMTKNLRSFLKLTKGIKWVGPLLIDLTLVSWVKKKIER